MIKSIRDMHKSGLLHRDLKPKNICVKQNNPKELIMIDFGISTTYLDSNGLHLPRPFGKRFCGTAEFTSLAAHNGCG